MEKVRYEIDPYNRLVLERAGNSSGLPRFRKVLNGVFRIGPDNELSYIIKAPLSEAEEMPDQLRLRGRFSLTNSHNLCLVLDKQERRTFGDRLVLEGKILDADANSLSFAVTTKTEEGQRTYVLNVAGTWRADNKNRLSFYINREKGRCDILTFNGVWEIGRRHQIIYRYEKADLSRKRTKTHTLTFKGWWDVKDTARLSYVLSDDMSSGFDFLVTAGIFREDFIKYEVGIGTAGRIRPATRTVTLYGRWNLKKDVGLLFEIEYDKGKTRAIIFGADAKLTDRDTVSFRLMAGVENRDMNIELELSRKILKGDGRLFGRFLKSKEELAVYAGAAWRW